VQRVLFSTSRGLTVIPATLAELARLNEAELRERVLIPLFKRMGFQDVRVYHGSGELGKDIVMWTYSPAGVRANYAVVAKAKRISGKVTGRSSAGEVFTQVTQCFGDPFVDQKTLVASDVHQCYVVTSRDIRPEALRALQAALKKSNLLHAVTFFDGEGLWKMVERFPELTLPQRTTELLAELRQHSGPVQVEPFLSLKIVPGDAAEIDPELLAMKGRFVFPATPEGVAARQEFEDHIRTGKPVTIRAPFLEGMSLPKVLERYVGEGVEVRELSLGARVVERPALMNVRLDADGAHSTLNAIEFRVVQIGTDEITLESRDAALPWRFWLALNWATRNVDFRFSMNLSGKNVRRQLEAFRFQRALARGGKLVLEAADSALFVASMQIPAGNTEDPPDAVLELLEAMELIQARTGVPLSVPDGEISPEQAHEVFTAAHVVRTGTIDYRGGATLTLPISRDRLRNLLSSFRNGAWHALTWQQSSDSRDVLGVTVPLGPFRAVAHAVSLTPETFAALERELDEGTESHVRVAFETGEQGIVTLEYAHWAATSPSPDHSSEP
jgi:hypothetical protein